MPIVHTHAGQVETITQGEGVEPFIMVHASGAGPRSLDRLARSLVGEQRMSIAPALVGYGATDVGETGDRVSQNVAAVERLVTEYNGCDVTLFGHSMGGLISLATAARCKELQPNPIKSLILFDPILVTLLRSEVTAEREALEWDRAIIAKLKREVAAGRPEPGVQAFIEAWNGQPWHELPEAVRRQFVALANTLVAETEATSYYPLEEDTLRRLRVPTLILVGERSPSLIHLTAARAAALLPKAEIEIIGGLDHMSPINNPKAVARAIEQFLERQS